MKRLLTTIIIVLFIKLAVAQTSIQKKEFVRKGDVTYIVSNQRLFPLNNRILTVKLFSGIKSLPKDMNVVRQNGLGYSDILVPEGKDIVDFRILNKSLGDRSAKERSCPLYYQTSIYRNSDFSERLSKMVLT